MFNTLAQRTGSTYVTTLDCGCHYLPSPFSSPPCRPAQLYSLHRRGAGHKGMMEYMHGGCKIANMLQVNAFAHM